MIATHKILYEHTGENLSTPKSPVAVFAGQVDLSETVTVCVSPDHDEITTTAKWHVHDVSLPDWLSPEEWIGRVVDWGYTWALGCDPEWPEATQRWLCYLCPSTLHRYSAIKLLKTKRFRSEFRRQLRDQIENWIETPPDERRYRSPLSDNQWAALTKWDRGEEQRICQELHWKAYAEAWTGCVNVMAGPGEPATSPFDLTCQPGLSEA